MNNHSFCKHIKYLFLMISSFFVFLLHPKIKRQYLNKQLLAKKLKQKKHRSNSTNNKTVVLNYQNNDIVPHYQKSILPFNDTLDCYFDAQWIEKIFQYNPSIKNVLEIGAHSSIATAHIASLLPIDGKIYIVNPLLESFPYKDSYINHYNNIKSCLEDAHKNLIDAQFYSNLFHKGVLDKISFSTDLTVLEKINIIYLHSQIDSIIEFRTIYYFLKFYYQDHNDHFILCGDNWNLDFIKAAIRTMAQTYKFTIYADDNFWFLKKEDHPIEKSFINDETDMVWKIL